MHQCQMLLNAVLRRRCCCASRRPPLSIDMSCPQDAQKRTRRKPRRLSCRTMGQTDRGMDARQLQRSSQMRPMRAVSVKASRDGPS